MTSSEPTQTPEELAAFRLAVEDTDLIDYCITFMKENGQLLGSGTLVSIDNTKAILTADHVLEALTKLGDVGLAFPTRFDNSPQSAPRPWRPLPIKGKYLEKKTVGKGKHEAEGPDLGLLVFPAPIISEFIPSTKTFYNLAKRCTRVMGNPWAIDTGIWVLVGAPEEWTEDAGPEAGFAAVKGHRGMMGVGGVNKEYERGGFDYLELPAIHHAGYEGPDSFEACSGGGLWHMQLDKTEDGQRVKEYLLSGVAFYQSKLVDDKRIVKCHGRKSIYQRVIEAVRLTASPTRGRDVEQ